MNKTTIFKGFTLLEVLIYVTIFAIVLGFLSSILIITTRVEMRESAAAEVTQQSSYVIQTIQRLVRESSQIEDATSSLLILRPQSTSKDKTTISLSGGVVYLREGDSNPQRALTSDKVTVNSLSFQKFSSLEGKDVVGINIMMTFKSDNPQLAISKTLRSAIARASAATFDSDLVPSGSKSVGQLSTRWLDGFFSGALTVGGSIKTESGDVYISDNTKGLILKDSNNICWRVRVSIAGSLSTSSTTCP